jgi:hypothetical protein
MTRQELDATLAKLELNVPEAERNDIANAVWLIEEMTALVRKPRLVTDESAHIVLFPKD